jgi:hypothetical protein
MVLNVGSEENTLIRHSLAEANDPFGDSKIFHLKYWNWKMKYFRISQRIKYFGQAVRPKSEPAGLGQMIHYQLSTLHTQQFCTAATASKRQLIVQS